MEQRGKLYTIIMILQVIRVLLSTPQESPSSNKREFVLDQCVESRINWIHFKVARSNNCELGFALARGSDISKL